MCIARCFFVLTFLSLLLAAPSADAGWSQDCTPVNTVMSDAFSYQAIPDGAGGTFIVWVDTRNDLGNTIGDIYAQRLDSFGDPVWALDGIPIFADGAASDQANPVIVSDGAGGAIITWEDRRSGLADVYAQRIDGSGSELWTAGGEVICSAVGHQLDPAIAADDSGGAIIAWEDYRTGEYDVYAQRIDVSGATRWLSDGVPVCTEVNSQFDTQIIADGYGGAVISWRDYRAGNADIYAQRLDASGNLGWIPFSGALVSASANNENRQRMTTDGYGGAIVVWEDNRGTSTDIYAQRIGAGGNRVWVSTGVSVGPTTNNQFYPAIVSDGAGGAIMGWEDVSTGQWLINTARLSNVGITMWTAEACTSSVEQHAVGMVQDEYGGVIVAWQGTTGINAQRIDASGNRMWMGCSSALCSAPGQIQAPVVVPDLSGAIVIWGTTVSGLMPDYIYAQRIDGRFGLWGHPEPQGVFVHDVAGDQGGQVKVDWQASDHDIFNLQEISHYSVWMATTPIAASPAGASPGNLVDPSEVGPDFKGPAVMMAGGYYWEWQGNQDAYYLPGYSYTAQTLNDSTSVDPGIHYFMVMSHTWDRFTFWESQVASGYSTDDLAPAAPAALVATRLTGSDVLLEWTAGGGNEPDFAQYALYRGTSSGVTPDPILFLSSALDTTYVDSGADPANAYYYVVTAVDVHENESGPSNEASVTGTATGIEDRTPALTELQVRPNVPNPFGASTEFAVGVPTASDLTVEVYDVTGRRVARRVYPSVSAGWQRLEFDGRGDRGRLLPSGVYFYRVTAAGTVVTRKMVIQR